MLEGINSYFEGGKYGAQRSQDLSQGGTSTDAEGTGLPSYNLNNSYCKKLIKYPLFCLCNWIVFSQLNDDIDIYYLAKKDDMTQWQERP